MKGRRIKEGELKRKQREIEGWSEGRKEGWERGRKLGREKKGGRIKKERMKRRI